MGIKFHEFNRTDSFDIIFARTNFREINKNSRNLIPSKINSLNVGKTDNTHDGKSRFHGATFTVFQKNLRETDQRNLNAEHSSKLKRNLKKIC